MISSASDIDAVGSVWADANGQRLFAETFGQSSHPAVLLIMGNSAPGLVWPDDFCPAFRGMDTS